MNQLNQMVKQILLTGGTALLFGLALGNVAWAQTSGALFTTTASNTTVNNNIYATKADAYLGGGPQNSNASGLPNGNYYFQVTDPSGAVLLSTDAIQCRELIVANGRVSGSTGSCPHSNGSFNPANSSTSVQLLPYADTPNNGGEYKAWITKIDDYNKPNCKGRSSNGFCTSDSKTDNFKVKAPTALPAYVYACKFNDFNNNGVHDVDEPTIIGWPMTAFGVDGAGSSGKNVVTGIDGCVSFAVTPIGNTFPAVSVTEGTMGVDWVKTAPASGSYPRIGSFAAFAVTDKTVSTSDLKSGEEFDIVFGNHNPNCAAAAQCDGPVTVTKSANPAYKVTWGISKIVDQTRINSSASGTFNYTVDVSRDGGSEFVVNGTIRIANHSLADVNVSSLTDSVDNGGVCAIAATLPLIVEAGEYRDVLYTCTYSSMPAVGTSTATATWLNVFISGGGTASGSAAVDFNLATVVDGTINVTDSVTGSLGTVSYRDANPKTFTYADTWTGSPGTCVDKPNTATFTSTTPNSTATGSASQAVKLCVGADMRASKGATPAFKRTYAWALNKSVDKVLVQQVGGNATFNYSVAASQTGFTDSEWTVTGTITVTNPNDWQAVTVNVADAINNGGTCVVTGGSSLVVPISSSATATYTCTYGSTPTATAFTNTATATWAQATYSTPGASASGTAGGAFTTPTAKVNATATVTDVFNGGPATPLGTLTATDAPAFASATYNYAKTVIMPAYDCVSYANTATIVETVQSASQSVKVCGPAKTGALTKGYWQNKNGQAIITGGASTAGVCNSATWLRTYAPFQDLSAIASCVQVAKYAMDVIKAADSSGAAMNAMLKAQMLATSMDVYFSSAALGGNKIAAPAPIGGVIVDLVKICKNLGSCTIYEDVSSVFGPANSLSIAAMLNFAASQSNAGGSAWYGQVKATQELAKDAFDAINNEKAFAAP